MVSEPALGLDPRDEARFGQKGRVCHRWFTRGQRPPGLCDQRYTWAHLFATVQPRTGQAFALVLPELRERHLSHRLLNSYDAIVEALCKAWQSLSVEWLISLTDFP